MSIKLKRNTLMAGLCGAALAGIVTPAMAGRCGHAYPVDEATTLAEVAKRCNVRLSALREANLGVDPNNVRPGQHLALPDEIDPAAPVTTSFAPANPNSEPLSVVENTASRYSYRDWYQDEDDRWRSNRIRVRDQRRSGAAAWRGEEALGARRHLDASNLSYQKLSAMRIQTASLTQPAPRLKQGPLSPEAHFIECPVLRKEDGGKIHKVRKIISTPEHTFVEINASPEGDIADCRLISASTVTPAVDGGVPSAHYGLPAGGAMRHDRPVGYRLPNYEKIGILSDHSAAEPAVISALRGEVIDHYQGCLLLRTNNGDLRKLSAADLEPDLRGKMVTVWGAPTDGGPCGAGPSFSVSYAVYAEPWVSN